MEPTKCITFDKEAQNKLPESVKRKIESHHKSVRREYKCVNCGTINHKKDNGQITVGFCINCDHPLWNPADEVR